MTDNKTSHTDEGLQDNEQIEQAILALQQQIGRASCRERV